MQRSDLEGIDASGVLPPKKSCFATRIPGGTTQLLKLTEISKPYSVLVPFLPLIARGALQMRDTGLAQFAIRKYIFLKRVGPSHVLDLRSEAKHLERPNAVPIHVYLEPFQPVTGRGGIRMMIVVPSFPKGQQGDKPVIGGIISCDKAARAPDVSYRVHQPSSVQAHHRSQKYTP